MKPRSLFLFPLALLPTSVIGSYQYKQVTKGTTSCRAEQDLGSGAYYTIEIGVAYDEATCKNAGNALVANFERTGHDQFKVTCHPRNKHQQTEMLFKVHTGNARLINPLLGAVFSGVNGFNCPDK